MHTYSTVSPIAQRLVQVHAIVEKIAGVNGPLVQFTHYALPPPPKSIRSKVDYASVDCTLPTVHLTFTLSPTVKWTSGKVADFEQNLEHPTLGFASQKSFQRKTNNSNVIGIGI